MRPDALMDPRPGYAVSAPGNGAGDASATEREREWQMATADLEAVRRWLARHPKVLGLSVEPRPTLQLHDIYLDTADWRVFRAGFALRLREKHGHVEATLKGLRSARDDLADRREITEPLPRADLEALTGATGPVGGRVHDIAGEEPLRELFGVRTSRQRFAVRSDDQGQEIGEIALDDAAFSSTESTPPVSLQRIEVEALGAVTEPLERLVELLRAECDLDPAGDSKFAVGLRSAALSPPQTSEPAPAAVDTSVRIGDLGITVLKRLSSEWLAHEPAARLGEDVEALHELRVAGRRINTVLSLLRPYLPPVLGRARQRLKSVLDLLGVVRDLDILLEAVKAFGNELTESERRALEPLLRHTESEHARARAQMLRALDAKPTRRWLQKLSSQPAEQASGAASASPRSTAALAVLPRLIRRRYRKLRKRARRLGPDSSMADYHAVRVRAKKLRYALEIVAASYEKPAEEMLAAVRQLQSRLGTQHDADLVARRLTQLATRPPQTFSTETVFLMGRLAERHERKAVQMASRIGKSWRRVSGRRWKALRARMKVLRNSAPKDADAGGTTVAHAARLRPAANGNHS